MTGLLPEGENESAKSREVKSFGVFSFLPVWRGNEFLRRFDYSPLLYFTFCCLPEPNGRLTTSVYN